MDGSGPRNKTGINLQAELKTHRSLMMSVARKLVGEQDAEDVVQDACLKAFRKLGQFNGDAQFSTWLYTITQNCAFNYLKAENCPRRGKALRIDVEDFTDLAADIASPEALMIADDAAQTVFDALALMSLPMRTVYAASLGGADYEELSAQFKLPLGTVRSRLYRARGIVDQAFGRMVTR